MTSNFWNLDELGRMHIELTNACNAACPMCPRFHRGSPLTRPDLEISQITLEQFQKWFPPEIIKKCECILFCGVHGDPCMAKDMYEICRYIMQVSLTTQIRVHTNGGMRNAEWWSKLGKLFSYRKESKNTRYRYDWLVTFSIDGLEDTNHIYRRNVKWDTLMRNAKAFIDAGGNAAWDFLIFKHNEHQLNEAKQLSEDMGFAEFVPKKALGVDDGTYLIPMPVLNRDGKLDYIIEAPQDPKNRNLENPLGGRSIEHHDIDLVEYKDAKETKQRPIRWMKKLSGIYQDVINNADFGEANTQDIYCKSGFFSGLKEIFVDNFGRVMPCCFVGTHLNGVQDGTKTHQLHYHMNEYGWDHFDLNKHSLAEILNEGHLNRVFADSWAKPSIKDGRLLYCTVICGKNNQIDKILTHDLNNQYEKIQEYERQRSEARNAK